MAGYRFPLAPLQRYREHQRDLCRQVLAQVLAEDAALQRRRDELANAREQLLAEMSALQQQPRYDITQAAARRYHAAQLLAQLKQVDLEREQVAERLQLCRQTLSKADQGVKVLEQLADKREAEFWKIMEGKESREREEIWQAGNLAGRSD